MAWLALYHDEKNDPTKKMFERLSKDPNVEKGLHILQDDPNEDPATREMAKTVLQEVEKGRHRRERSKALEWIMAGFILIITIVLIVFGILYYGSKRY